MSVFVTQAGTRIYYKDWGQGQPILFSHGWPLTADAWDGQMLYFGQQGYRVIAHDRRGHGRSEQTWDRNTMDQFADDLAELIDELNLGDLILVGHSTGGGEVTRYLGRHGTRRVSKLVLVGAIPPLMLKTKNNPRGLPLEAFDDIRKGVSLNRSQFYKDLSLPFYGYNREGAKISEGLRESFWLQGMQGSIKAEYDSVEQFSESDFTEDLKKIDIPTLIIHGSDDQIVPIQAAAMLSSKLIQHAQLKVYQDAPHGLAQTLPERFNADLLQFFRESAARSVSFDAHREASVSV
ncbi:MAG TPA: alpha/beta hydrolase [Oligoflexus sp.]|uniref:alpha/beta fold hydrolase n=1 Tax=Oligoflexus sp. TaxID=1971216 RepID=UPI002D7E3074|nr:alpha/beta hydrolase [Oligoflexus sp.]HET9237149.1 alpha/beta hydrolase [Oligoflexus sp.]